MGLNFGSNKSFLEHNEYRRIIRPTDMTWSSVPTANPDVVIPNGATGYYSVNLPQNASITKIYIEAEGDFGQKLLLC